MHKYEIMFILRPDLNESGKTSIFGQIKDTLGKFDVKISSADIWADKKKLYFDIALKGKSVKFSEGLYYLVEFEALPQEIKNITAAFRLNEEIIRFLVTVKDETKRGV